MNGKHSPRSWLAGGPLFDGVSIALSAWVMTGLFLDGWAHQTQPQLESFLTPWHVVLYSGVLAQMVLLGAAVGRNQAGQLHWWRALPPGYRPSLVGAGIFLLAGVTDFAWHTAFGIEASIAALLSPPHLALAAGLALMLTGPLRAAWRRSNTPTGWICHLPMLTSLTLLLALLGFFTGYGHPFTGAGLAAGSPPIGPELEYSYEARGILGILLQTGLLMGGILPVALRLAGGLPFGAVTLVLGMNGLLLSPLGGRYTLVPAALLAGVAADVWLRWQRPSRSRRGSLGAFAIATPVTLWTAYFVTLELFVGHVWWPVHLWAGVVVLAGLEGLLICVAVLPVDEVQPNVPLTRTTQPALRENLARLRTLNRILEQWDEHDIAAMSGVDARGISLLDGMRQELLEQMGAYQRLP